MLKNHTRLDLVEGGNIIKQGDQITLAFYARDYKGEIMDLTGKTVEGEIYSKQRGIIYQAAASYDEATQKIFFTITELLDAGRFQIEFTITDANDADYQLKVPTDKSDGALTINASSVNIDYVGVSMTTVAQLRNEQQAAQTEFANEVLPRVNTVEGRQDELEEIVQAGVGAFTEDTEVVTARMGEPSLLAYNQKTTALLAEKAALSYVDTKVASVASGAPKGAYATLTELQTAFPTGNTNIYLVRADGKWYYWSGSAWAAGGIYQGTEWQEGINARQSTVKSKTFTTVKDRFEDIETGVITGITNGVKNSELANATDWGAFSGSNSVANGELTFTPTAITGSHGPNQVLTPAVNGDKVYSTMEIFSAKSGQLVYHHFFGATRNTATTVAGTWVKSAAYAAVTDATQTMFAAYRQSTNVADLTDTFKIKKPLLLNLTKIFGAGKEPTQAEIEKLIAKVPQGWWSGALPNNSATRAIYDLQREDASTINQKADKSSVDKIDKTLFKANNIVPNGDFSVSPSGWNVFNATQNVVNSELVVNVTSQYGSATRALPFSTAMRGHQLYFRVKVKASYAEAVFSLIDTVVTTVTPVGSGTYEILSGIKTVSATATSLSLRVQDIKATGRLPIYIDDALVINLTETFGNDIPSKIEMDTFINSLAEKNIASDAPVMTLKDLYNSQTQFRNEINMNSLPFIMPSFKSPRRPMITITYDDESVNIYDHAFPVHKAESAPGTFYVVPSRIGTGKQYDWGVADTWDRIKEMDKSGVMKIECHTNAHEYLPALSRKALETNFKNSISLFRRQGITIKHIAYPGGYYNDLVQQVVQQYYQSGRTTGRDVVTSYQGHTYDIRPYAIDAMGIDGALAFAKSKVDQALANNCWMDFFMHAVHPDGQVTGVSGVVRECMTPAELTELIQYAKSKGVEVATFDEALQTYAPIFCWIDDQANSPMVIKRDSTIDYNVQGHAPFLLP